MTLTSILNLQFNTANNMSKLLLYAEVQRRGNKSYILPTRRL